MTAPVKTHKRFSASAMERILNCPRSVPLSEGAERRESGAAAEGTCAHALADTAFELFSERGKALDAGLASRDASWLAVFESYCDRWGVADPESVLDEMVEHVQLYLDTCKALIDENPDAEWQPEQLIEMDHIHPECGGTTDFSLFAPSRRKLWVVDFKYGKGKFVTVEQNPQAMTYALGTLLRLGNRRCDTVEVMIVQPRCPGGAPVRSWEAERLEIMAFGQHIRDAIAAAEDVSTPLDPGGWCTFCPVRSTCAAYRDYAIGDVLQQFGDVTDTEDGIPAVTMLDPVSLTPRQLRRVMTLTDTLRDWIKAVDEHAYSEAIAGRIPPGMKLVPKRGRRYYTDEAVAQQALLDVFKLSLDDVAPRKLVSVAVAEKMVGKKLFTGRKLFGGDKTLADYTEKKSSGYNLVSEDDPRPSVVKTGAADEFEPT